MIERKIFLLLIILFCNGIGYHISNATIVKRDGGRGKRKNVILISLDTLRADHLGCYGYNRNTTPFLDTFAKKGILFENCISTASWTLPAHVSLLTALYSSSHSVIDDGLGSIPPMLQSSIPPEIKTLPEILQDKGFETRAITSHLYVSDRFGFERGFNTFHYKQGQSAEEVTQKALSWLDILSDRPFFLFLHYFDCHDPYASPPPYRNMFDPDYEGDIDGSLKTILKYATSKITKSDLNHLIALYDGEIRYVDDFLRRFIERIEKAGLLENTMIIITSDHGEEFKDHGSLYHGHTLFDELIRVPLLLFLPGDIPIYQRRIKSQVSLVDIMPTILDFLELDIPQGIEGETLIPYLKNVISKPRLAYSETSRYKAFQACVRTEEYKNIISDGFNGHKKALYNLISDPGEKVNMADSSPMLLGKFGEGLLNNLDIVLKEQVCLRIATARGAHAFTGEVRTSGRFLYLDTIGWWPKNTVNLNKDRNLLTINYPSLRGRVGINLVIDPPDANISFSDWKINNNPVEISMFQKGEHNVTGLKDVRYRDLVVNLISDPDLPKLKENQVLLFKTRGMIPRKSLTEGKVWENKKISEEDREKLKALGYLQ
jgi:arylsulfatase A-like enzyme